MSPRPEDTSEASATTSESQIVAQKSPLHSAFPAYHPPVAFCSSLGKDSLFCRLHWIPRVPIHCPYFELPADWLETFEERKWEDEDRPALKFIKFHRGNLHFLLAKLCVVSDLNPIDLIIWEMSLFSLKLALKASIWFHFGCPSSPQHKHIYLGACIKP